jgi:ABC-type nitrate/sulfonate/bicarbonate transport system permease component
LLPFPHAHSAKRRQRQSGTFIAFAESISGADMLHKLILALLLLLVIVALQRIAHAQDCQMSSQSEITQEGQAAGFDNPILCDGCDDAFSAIPTVVLGYALGIFIGIVRAITGESSLRSMSAKVLNI